MSTVIHEDLVLIALDRVDPTRFERFAQDLLSALVGRRFVPLGGTRDGGADGLFEDDAGGHFVQITKEEGHRSKVRKTVLRLQDFGRTPTRLTYVTSRKVPHIDREEDHLSEKHELAVRIRDRSYIVSHVNDSPATRAAFEQHLRPELAFLQSVGKAPVLPTSKHVTRPDVYVFLRQETERRQGTDSLVNGVADALILWALEGTDPDQGLTMSRDDVRTKILDAVPVADKILDAQLLNNRLQLLSGKNPKGRAVRWYRKTNTYCLPFETRKRIEDENQADTVLQLAMRDALAQRAATAVEDGSDFSADMIAGYCLSALQRTFEREGLLFAHFLEQEQSRERVAVADSLFEVLDESDGENRETVAELCMQVLRGVLYHSVEVERRYLAKLARTYAILFTLNVDPRLVRYFEEMRGNFRLLVGTDVLVRALSERYLAPEDQMTRNMLRVALDSGAKLMLTEPVLDELVRHLQTTDFEFENFFASSEGEITVDIAREARKILIRTYFYAKLEPARHSGHSKAWRGFVGQFCDYSDLHSDAARRSLRDYLTSTFGMEFLRNDELLAQVDSDELKKLTDEFDHVKKKRVLAENDAALTLGVYALRDTDGEGARGNPFGFQTWWLTSEAAILSKAKRIIGDRDGSRFIMRPDFLLNFISLSPKLSEVRETYASVFPTMHGIRLAKRMRAEDFAKVMRQVDEAMSLEDGRRQAAVAKLSDELKSDFARQYKSRWTDSEI